MLWGSSQPKSPLATACQVFKIKIQASLNLTKYHIPQVTTVVHESDIKSLPLPKKEKSLNLRLGVLYVMV